MHQDLNEGVVEGEEIIGIGDADFRETRFPEVREHDVPVLVVVDKPIEIGFFRLIKPNKTQKIRYAVFSCRDQEELVALQFHPVPLVANIEIVSCKHLPDGLDIVIFDDGVGDEKLFLVSQRVIGLRQ